MEFKFINEQSIMIYFNNHIEAETFQKVQQVEQYIKLQNNPAIIEIVPSYRAILLYIDTNQSDIKNIVTELKLDQLDLTQFNNEASHHKTVHIPVLYGGEYGQDLEEVANYNEISTDAVVQMHTNNTYLIYMLGFMPGFPFLGGLNEKLHTPRRQDPRTRIPAGSVGIANNQTGLYPKESPGGWQIIGRTPLNVFDIHREVMCLYAAGDYIKFYSITEETYHEIVEEQKHNNFNIDKWVEI
ncbi:allophanate hydrolase [Staphylococcus succinus]|uniref:Allophanate hydrolase n=1 Tax=Staphylococcus succinus TaxID=61015 RepID=A0A9Q6HPW6_9STAP|nr:5-oxoprolinase subunit PxpB [Staphylococcus succinus]PKI23349.1 allophanate hydrolase [Staphylococcus succinus]PTI76480.1 allophanate hydrolase [Staphylococcus succinus]PTJ84956.1 allophanate hydrolase [Staphylococcus succinus]RIN23667.1 5-oxoprolinase subunit PxpB [Staphylococcus succinus]RIN35906.1 5-oxoprolinase subunit PxpB [Staphylococcus succinus]